MDIFDKDLYVKGINGRAVIILHGFGSGSSIKQLDFLFQYFAKHGYTVARPDFGTFRDYQNENFAYPQNWLKKAEFWYDRLADRVDKIFVIGISFGGNIAVSLASKRPEKIGGVITLEMPVYFKRKIWFALTFLQPIFQFFGLKLIPKNRIWYRGKYSNRDGSDPFPFVPVVPAGRIYSYVMKNTRKELRKIDSPIFIMQAMRSDMIDIHRIRDVYEIIKTKKKQLYRLPLYNHSISSINDEGKRLVLEQILRFIEKN